MHLIKPSYVDFKPNLDILQASLQTIIKYTDITESQKAPKNCVVSETETEDGRVFEIVYD